MIQSEITPSKKITLITDTKLSNIQLNAQCIN
jgi:hypothetical protein